MKVICLTVSISSLLCSCVTSSIGGSGVSTLEKRSTLKYEEVQVNADLVVEVTQEVPESEVWVSGDQNLLYLIKTTVKGGVLKVELDEACECKIAPQNPITVKISGAHLALIDLSQAAQLSINKLDLKDFKLRGRDQVKISMLGTNVQDFSVKLEEEAALEWNGKAKLLQLNMEDDSKMLAQDSELEGLEAELDDQAAAALGKTLAADVAIGDSSALTLDAPPPTFKSKVEGQAKLIFR